MKFFLMVALLSGSCIYGMEEDKINELKKSQNLKKNSDYAHIYYAFPGEGPVSSYPENNSNNNDGRKSLISSGHFPSQFSIPNTINTTNTINTIVGYHLNKK